MNKTTTAALYPKVGDTIFIRTVTHHYTGRVVAADKSFVALADAAWIAEDGRFTQTIADGTFNEVEPYPDTVVVRISLGAVVDWCEWLHDLPRVQK